MRFLLTSAGIKNTSIHEALVDLLGKPIAESTALMIPTAIYPFLGGAGMAWQAICGQVVTPYNCDAEFDLQNVPPRSDRALEGDRALGLVDFTCTHIWIARGSRTRPRRTSKRGRPGYRSRLTRSTTTPPSRWSTAPSKSSPKANWKLFTSNP